MLIGVLITITGITVGIIATAATMKGLSYLVTWLSKK